MPARGVGMKAPRHSAAQSTTQSRESRTAAPSAVAALNRRVGNGRLQQALLQRSPGYSTNCESLTYKTCKGQSCGYGGSGRCGWTGIKGGCKCVSTIKPPVPPRVPELVNSRPGQAVDIDGQAFNAIIQMSTGE